MRQHFHAARRGSQSAYKAKATTPNSTTNQQRFKRRTDHAVTPPSKQSLFPGWIAHGVGSLRQMDEAQARDRRGFKQLRVHISGGCRFSLASTLRRCIEQDWFIRCSFFQSRLRSFTGAVRVPGMNDACELAR
jgi:hypothetical protein